MAAGLARLAPSKNRFPQQKVFQDELPFAGNEWAIANTACRFKIGCLGPRFSADDLVQSIAVRTAEKRRCIRTRHEHWHQFFAKLRGEQSGHAKLTTSLKSPSARRSTALIRIRNGLRLRSTDQKTVVEKSTNDRSAI